MTKGKTPIQKNITVVDEQGNIYEATYPKRARGLVKNGRARFLSEDTICLACPPEILEEHMSDKDLDLLIKKGVEEGVAAGAAAKATDSIKSEALQKETAFKSETADLAKSQALQSDKFSMDYVLEQIEKIASQTEYLGQIIGAVGHLENSEDLDSDAALEAKAMALGDVVRCRETTNQQLIRFYEKMYDNIREEAHIREQKKKVSG